MVLVKQDRMQMLPKYFYVALYDMVPHHTWLPSSPILIWQPIADNEIYMYFSSSSLAQKVLSIIINEFHSIKSLAILSLEITADPSKCKID